MLSLTRLKCLIYVKKGKPMRLITKLLLPVLLTATLNADEAIESNILDNFTLTNISFNMDENGNLNPYIFIPLYYGSSEQFYSSIGYSSTNSQKTEVLDGFSDSKNAFISSSKDLTLNYITYKHSLFGYAVSIGVESTFSDVKNNEFGYIHDKDDVFGHGADYYVSFDDSVDLSIQRHAIRADVVVPMGEYFSSRFFTSISPYTSIGVKQSTLFKPLVPETGSSSSTTVQDLSYTLRYDGLIRTGTFVNIALVASYAYQPLKYDVAQLAKSGSSFVFETNKIDTVEETSRYIAKLLFNVKVLGGLKPSLGYGIEKLKRTDNIQGNTNTIDKTIVTIGFEKMF